MNNLQIAILNLLTYDDWQCGRDPASGKFYCDIFDGNTGKGEGESLCAAIEKAIAAVGK